MPDPVDMEKAEDFGAIEIFRSQWLQKSGQSRYYKITSGGVVEILGGVAMGYAYDIYGIYLIARFESLSQVLLLISRCFASNNLSIRGIPPHASPIYQRKL
nr:hypothetical protein CFP56_67056 [Quercus suber]